MKISMVEFSGNSGLTHYSYNLCKTLSIMGNIEVELITSNSYELEGFNHNFKVTKIFRRTRHYPLDIWKFISYVLKIKPDVIHFQSILKFPIVEKFIIHLFHRLGMKNIVLTIHDVLPHNQTLYHKMLYKWFYGAIPKIIVHSKSAYDMLVSKLEYNGAIEIIPHGEYSFFNSNNSFITCTAARQHLGIDLKKKIILFFGRIRPDKGLEYLLKSFAEVIRKYPNALLAIIGNPQGSFQKYARIIKNHEIEDKVFTRLQRIPIEDIKFYVTASDFVVLPYIESTTSGVVQLAYGFLKPVIATDVGNLPDVIDDGETGFIVPSKNTDKMTEKILILLNNDSLLKRMSQTILKKNKNEFSWEKIASNTIKFYFL